jgi:hypothetical protein
VWLLAGVRAGIVRGHSCLVVTAHGGPLHQDMPRLNDTHCNLLAHTHIPCKPNYKLAGVDLRATNPNVFNGIEECADMD